MAKDKHISLNIWQKIGLFFYSKRTITIGIWLVVAIFGAVSYTTFMRKEGFPSVDVPLGIVQIITLDETAEGVDRNYALPVTQLAKDSGGVKDIISSANDQGATIQIVYEDGTDVQSKLDALKVNAEQKIPKNAQLIYIKVNASALTSEGDDVIVSVHGEGLTPEQLGAAADKLMPILEAKISLAEKVRVIKLIETVQDPQTGESSSEQVRFDRYYDKESKTLQPSVSVGINGRSGVDQLKLFDEIAAVLKSSEVADIGADAAIAADFAESIREQVSGLQRNLLEGLIVVLIVSFILISLRGSIVTALAMTTTVLMTIGILNIIGYTINTITLFSLVLCLALIVDDTTIIVEAIDAGLKKGGKFKDVVLVSLKKVARASATGTFATTLAFAPMLFIGGVLGKFIRAIPVTIIISLLVSLLVSVVFIPLFMRLSYGRRIKKQKKRMTFVNKFEEGLSDKLSNMLLWSSKTKVRSIATKLNAVFFSLLVVGVGMFIFTKVEFNIFPAPKDGIEIILQAQIKNRESAAIGSTEQLSDKILEKAKVVLGDNLERITLNSQSGSANRDGFTAAILLNSISERDQTSVALAKTLQKEIESLVTEMQITAEAAGVGPPEGNFTVQIKSDDIAKSALLIEDVKSFLQDVELKRPDSTTAGFKDVQVTPVNIVTRDNGNRIVKVSGNFDAKDVSALTQLAEKAVEEEFSPERVQSYGLSPDALEFDFGQEEENQKSFESMGRAIGPLFLAILILMAILFRSIMQPILILLALPFAFFGVASGLYLTKNPISFFAMLGVFALIGISLNNSILLTDFANQAQKEGQTAPEAMASAIKARLRALLTTSITSILALLPLALNDPFWEGLAYTLIFGLLSSTIMVIIAFPYFYLIEEALRSRIRRLLRRPV